MKKHHIILVIVGAVILIIIGGFLFTWAPVFFTGFGQQSEVNQIAVSYGQPSQKNQSESSSTSNSSELVGTWESDCLVPEPSNKWAEKHQFVITNSTATHTRWSNDTAPNCDSFDMTLVNKYTYTIPMSGQINFIDTEQGTPLYDIYQLTGNTLEFGHGFRNKLAYPAQDASSIGQRLGTLNAYIVYKKK